MPFQNEPLSEMIAIGAVEPRAARIWFRTESPARVCLRWWREGRSRISESHAEVPEGNDTDNTASVRIDHALEPERDYRIEVLHEDGRKVGAGRFTTAPEQTSDIPRRFSIALMSCHQPFAPDGSVAAHTEPMLEAARRCFARHDVRQVIMAGDQLYTDYPKHVSLFDGDHFDEIAPPGRESVLECTSAEMRRLFHARYRHFWNIEGWRRIMAEYPCYPILDDHEIVDNWGSSLDHATARWQSLREGALRSYSDYQASRVQPNGTALPHAFDYEVVFADTATYVLDLRSNRRVGEHARVISDAQEAGLARFLHRHGDKSVLFLVLSVPIVHLPRRLAQAVARVSPTNEDFSDRWSSRGHQFDRDHVLKRLHDHQRDHPGQRIVLLSGDIHIGCVHRLHWSDHQPNLYQLISSGVTHDTGRLIQSLSSAIILLKRRVVTDHGDLSIGVRLLKGERGYRGNPSGRLNLGIVEVTRSRPEASPDLRFLLYGHRDEEPECLFRSSLLASGTLPG